MKMKVVETLTFHRLWGLKIVYRCLNPWPDLTYLADDGRNILQCWKAIGLTESRVMHGIAGVSA